MWQIHKRKEETIAQCTSHEFLAELVFGIACLGREYLPEPNSSLVHCIALYFQFRTFYEQKGISAQPTNLYRTRIVFLLQGLLRMMR